jgi:light-regulated signal transduction histidine kinase (bacteriophytochrome)
VDFEELYRATYPRVLAYARSMASREDADNAVAEAYAIAWRRQRDIPRSAELGWLIGVTRRVLANARRSRRRAGALHALLDLQPQTAGPDPADQLEVSAQAGRVRITVRDDGPGLAPELGERAFDPGVRGPQASSPGAGLGLPLARRLARSCGGDVLIGDGPGGSFVLELPAVRSVAER